MIGMLLILFAQAEPQAKASLAEISPRTKAILAKLDEPIPMEFPKETPLDDVLQYIKRSTRKGPSDPGIPIYIDPFGLQAAGRSLNSTVAIRVKGSPLKDTLPKVLSQVGLTYCVKDDVLIISSPTGIDREQKAMAVPALDTSPRTKSVLAKLEEPIAMRFENETPLSDVLEYIKRATKKGPNDPEIPILIVPSGLEETERSLNSTITIDLENVPLKTTLRLLLKQLGLAYGVKDGRLIIHSEEGIRKLKQKADGESKGKADERGSNISTGCRSRELGPPIEVADVPPSGTIGGVNILTAILARRVRS